MVGSGNPLHFIDKTAVLPSSILTLSLNKVSNLGASGHLSIYITPKQIS